MSDGQPEMRVPVRVGAPNYWGLTHNGHIVGAIRAQRYRGWSYRRTSWWQRRKRGDWIVREDFWDEVVVVEGANAANARTYCDYYHGPNKPQDQQMVQGWNDYELEDTECLVVDFDEGVWGAPEAWFIEWDSWNGEE